MAKRLGEILIDANQLTEGKLTMALKEQERWGGKIGDILVRMNFATEEVVYRGLATQQNLAYAELDNVFVPEAVMRKVPEEHAQRLQVIPLEVRENKVLVVATADPRNVRGLDALSNLTGLKLQVKVAGPGAIAQARARAQFEEISDASGEFKLVDMSGNTVNLTAPEEWRQPTPAPSAPAVVAAPVAAVRPPQPVAQPVAQAPAPAPVATQPNAVELARAVDELKREVVFLRSLMGLLVEKGVLTREECLARMKR